MNKIIQFLNGKKTYIIGICAIVYGFYSHNYDAIILGLGFMGVRQGISTEVSKLLPIIDPAPVVSPIETTVTIPQE